MARSRTWNLRLNLDEFNAAVAALDDDNEKAQFLAGLSRGANGAAPKPGASVSFSEGFTIGSRMRQEAEGFRVVQAANGAKGGRPRSEPEVNPDETQSEPMGSQKETQSEPKVNPNHNPQSLKPVTEIPKPPEAAAPPPEVKPKPARSWKDLFISRPDAATHFEAILASHGAARNKILGRKEAGTLKECSAPDIKPSPDARAFLALVEAGHSPRLLRACHARYLKTSDRVEDGFLQSLSVFFGQPGGKSKATWEGLVEDARALLAEMDAHRPAALAPPPAAAPPTPLRGLDAALAAQGLLLPPPVSQSTGLH